MTWPRFDEPRLTVPIQEALSTSGLALPKCPPIPHLHEPATQSVTNLDPEPLVDISHPGLTILENYRKAGWPAAYERCVCRSSVRDALVAAAESLPPSFGLAVFDAWRPLALQNELYLAALADPSIPEWLVAKPDDDPMAPPPHLSGGAVDVTLTIDGTATELGTLFDDATERAFARSLEDEPGDARDGRRVLYWAMRSAGFIVFADEWWHFELGTRRWAAVTGNQPRFGAIVPPTSLTESTSA